MPFTSVLSPKATPQLQYHPDYYATWVLDPDGHDVEVVNKTGQID